MQIYIVTLMLCSLFPTTAREVHKTRQYVAHFVEMILLTIDLLFKGHNEFVQFVQYNWWEKHLTTSSFLVLDVI